MNIFEALSLGKRRINEENTSSFIAYLLKDNESHGLKREFFKRFFSIAELNIDDIEDYNITVKLENKVKGNRFIDILITLNDIDSNEIKYVIGIENKISPQSCQKTQLFQEYTELKEDKVYENATKFIIFLVPDKNNKYIKNEYDYAVSQTQDTKNVKMLEWKKVIEEIKLMLNDEHEAKITPISDYLKQTLKAFYYYINHLTDTKITKKVKVTYAKYPSRCYELIMLSDGSMRIKSKAEAEDEDDEGLIPKHMIFDVLFALGYKSDRTTRFGKSIDGTPRNLGTEMFNILKKKKIKEINIKDETPCFSPYNTRTNSNIF